MESELNVKIRPFLILESKLGFGPNMGPQTDPKLAYTECLNHSSRAWPYEEWRTEMMPRKYSF